MIHEIHTHPVMEKELKIINNHCIVDRDVIEKLHKDVRCKTYVIWSIKKGKWRTSNGDVYTSKFENATRYSFLEACEIIKITNKDTSDIPNDAMIKIK